MPAIKTIPFLLFLSFYWFAKSVIAGEIITVEQALVKCKTLYPNEFEAKKRLACFDSIETPNTLQSLQLQPLTTEDTAKTTPTEPSLDAQQQAAPAGVAVEKPNKYFTHLDRKWRLTSEGDWNISDFETYKANYLVVTKSSSTNDVPVSPSHPNTEDRHLQSGDLKFQLSLKTELMNNLPLIRNLPYVTSSRLWGAYTQKSYWQIFNSADSRPLRENDYEPELILSLGIDNKKEGERVKYIPRMLNFGVVHQSNGGTNPLSRSWNRLYIESGWELTDRITLLARPWLRFGETNSKDDNPDIEKYLGYGDLTLHWEDEKDMNAVSLLLRNNLRANNKGFAELDLMRRSFDNPYIKLHLLLSTGYGESLLDYNHSNSTIGFGISLGE